MPFYKKSRRNSKMILKLTVLKVWDMFCLDFVPDVYYEDLPPFNNQINDW